MKAIVLTLALLNAVPLTWAQSEAPEAALALPAKDAKRLAEQDALQAGRVLQAQHKIDLVKSRIAMADDDSNRDVLELQTAFDVVGGPGRGASQPLVVRTSDMDPKALANIQEDLTVMSRILNKTVEREVGKEGHDSAMGIVISTLPGARRPQSIYLEGYGALFMVNVRFPLLPPSSKDQEKPDKVADSTWEQTRRELYSGPERQGAVRFWDGPAIGQREVEYDPEQVDALRKALVETLKNAANIRDVRPEEYITVAVFGTRAGGPVKTTKHTFRPGAGNKAEFYAFPDAGHGGRETNLTIRAKKGDVDALAKGELDAEQFKKRVSTATY